RNFYMRRLLRIFPLYYGILALVFFVAPLIPLLRGPTLDYLVDRQAWAWLYAVNIYIAKHGEWSFSYLDHFWSLAIEEHFSFVWTRLVSREGLELVLPVRAALILMLLAGLLVWALIAQERSATSRFFCSRSMVFLGTYSYGLYVYHHFISYYLTSNRTDLKLALWLGSHPAAVALQATLGAFASLALAYLSYELFEKRFLRLKRLFERA